MTRDTPRDQAPSLSPETQGLGPAYDEPSLARERASGGEDEALKVQPGTTGETDETSGPDETGGPGERDLSSPLDGDDSRRDEGVKKMGFRKWLTHQRRADNPQHLEFIPYWGIPGTRWPVTYNYEEWAGIIQERFPDEADDVLTYLVRAEATWRAEQAAADLTADAYGIAPQTLANKLTYRTAQADVKCGLTHVDGRTCGREVVPGSTRCADHGGALVDGETRRAMLLSSYASLVTNAQVAVDCLVDVAQNSRNDLARVSASKEILDRVGLTPDLNINVTVTGETNSPVEKLKSRLDQISDRLQHPVVDTHAVEKLPELESPATGVGAGAGAGETSAPSPVGGE